MTQQTISILLLIIQNMQSTNPTFLMLGIKNSGKTQFVKTLCGHSDRLVMPTMGCAHQYYSRFLTRDPIDQELFQGSCESNYLTADCIIFVISLLDFHYRKDEVKQALIDALFITGNKPFMIVINMRDSSSYDLAAWKNEVRWNLTIWWRVIIWLMGWSTRPYRFLWCDVKDKVAVKNCFDEMAKSI